MATIIKRIISTAKAPRPQAPYSQAVVIDRTVYLSGVLGTDISTGKLVAGGAVPEAVKAFEHIRNILDAAGSKVENVIKCTVLLNDMADFAAINQEYVKGERKAAKCAKILKSLTYLFFSLHIFSVHNELSGANVLPGR